jgi:hypothetical protein
MRGDSFQKEWIIIPAVVFIIIIGILFSHPGQNSRTGNITAAKITSKAIEKILPKAAASSTDQMTNDAACSATICIKKTYEVYCPESYAECAAKYKDCRKISCDAQDTESPTTETETNTEDNAEANVEDIIPDYVDTSGQGVCTEEYNDCYDRGTPVICKGNYDQCCASFDNCVCGTGDTADTSEQAKPDIDTTDSVECTTAVYVCSRQVITMSGEVASSTVTCKSDFTTCSTMYGSCVCGNSTLTDFPTKVIGSSEDVTANANRYWCQYQDKQIPCYMMPEKCMEKKNTCEKANGIKVTCEGTFDFCNKQYGGKCYCGIESLTSGFMKTTAD